tara:strand:+ start:1222 stop:1479 length:258 start_codon:yes stop_codon:yes gene_type:complete
MLIPLIIIFFLVIILSNYEGFVNYPDAINDCKHEPYYKTINENILVSPRLNSYRSYYDNKDMYSLNSRILKDKKCRPNGIPTSFH